MTERIRPCLCALDDAVLRARLAAIVQEHAITTVVETGIDWGGSTMFFSEMVPYVVGIDNDAVRVEALRLELQEKGIKNVDLVCMNSPDALRAEVEGGLNASHTLFFLDAHWQAYWPLKDEIRAIPRGQGILVMHDARVPGCPNLGVDSYDGQELSYEYVREELEAWSLSHTLEYNDDSAEGSRRGVMIVYPEAL